MKTQQSQKDSSQENKASPSQGSQSSFQRHLPPQKALEMSDCLFICPTSGQPEQESPQEAPPPALMVEQAKPRKTSQARLHKAASLARQAWVFTGTTKPYFILFLPPCKTFSLTLKQR